MPRAKGVKNKITLEVKEKLRDIIFENTEKLQSELNNLQGRAFVSAYVDLLAYIIPKAQEQLEEIEPPKFELIIVDTENNPLPPFKAV